MTTNTVPKKANVDCELIYLCLNITGSNKADYETLADSYDRHVLQFLFVCCCPEVFCSKRGNFLQDKRPLCHSTEMATKDIYPKYSHQTNANQIQMFIKYLTIQHVQNCVLCSVFSVPIILIISEIFL